jgi:hypothetical protein
LGAILDIFLANFKPKTQEMEGPKIKKPFFPPLIIKRTFLFKVNLKRPSRLYHHPFEDNLGDMDPRQSRKP